jgi:hypothetical protein
MTDEPTVRSAIAARIASIGAPWSESAFQADMTGRDPSTIQHGCFSVDMPSSQNVGERSKTVIMVRPQVVVRFCWSIKPLDQVESYSDAQTSELLLLRTLLPDVWTGDFRLLWASSVRRTLDDGVYRLVEMTFNAQFYLSLES